MTNFMMRRTIMSKTQPQLSLFDRLAFIDKEVIRVLGKQKDNIITITSIDVFHSYVSACINTGVIAIDTETNNIIPKGINRCVIIIDDFINSKFLLE